VISISLYSRPGCHLCDDMKAVVDRVARTVPLEVEIIDVSADPALEARYGLEVPVLAIDGKKAAKYRVSEEDLRRMVLARRGPAG